MDPLPQAILAVLRPFEGAFSERVWEWAKLLVVGAILAPGQRTVAAVLRVLGQSGEQQFQNEAGDQKSARFPRPQMRPLAGSAGETPAVPAMPLPTLRGACQTFVYVLSIGSSPERAGQVER